MVSITRVKELAIAFPHVTELPHFEKSSFRIGGKIFVTINEKENRICVKLSQIDQSVFCVFD